MAHKLFCSTFTTANQYSYNNGGDGRPKTMQIQSCHVRFIKLTFLIIRFCTKDTAEDELIVNQKLDSCKIKSKVYTLRRIEAVAKNKWIELYKSMRLLRSIEWL